MIASAIILLFGGCNTDECPEGTAQEDGQCSEDGETADSTSDLTQDEYIEQFGEKLCSAYASCNPSVVCDPSDDATEVAGCSFDPVSAQICLESELTCNDDYGPGSEFIELHPACGNVFYDCP